MLFINKLATHFDTKPYTHLGFVSLKSAALTIELQGQELR